MNYKKLYFNIIRNRRNNPLSASEYGETHHIKPRSFGGLDTPNNLIRLSAREHFIVHFLLYKIYKHRVQNVFQRSNREMERYKKMTLAFNIMINAKSKSQKRLNKNINNRAFEQLRKTVSEQQTKYSYEFVKEMFDFYIQNNLTSKTINVLNKQFHTDFIYVTLKKLFYKHNLKISDYREQKRYTKEKVKEMFNFYIQNNLTSKTIDILNKQFHTDFIYATLKKLFYKHNLKISDYRENSLFKQKYSTETIKQMFNFYISNDLSPKTIHVLNKKFNQNLTYAALQQLFYKNNLKISEYKGK